MSSPGSPISGGTEEPGGQRATFDAMVVARRVESGQSVVVGLQPQALLVLAKAGEMAARFKISADQIGGLKVGQAVTVKTGKQDYPATLRTLGLEAIKDKDGVAYEVDAVFAVKELLRAGTVATVTLP